MKVAVITVSDSASRGEREDKSGDVVRGYVDKLGGTLVECQVTPDEQPAIAKCLIECCEKADLVLTTGGTGVSPRDVTPEATRGVIDREIPGFGEIMRVKSFEITPRAVISRALAGMRGKTLIINLPGSPKAVEEMLDLILPAIPHTIEKIQDKGGECAREQ